MPVTSSHLFRVISHIIRRYSHLIRRLFTAYSRIIRTIRTFLAQYSHIIRALFAHYSHVFAHICTHIPSQGHGAPRQRSVGLLHRPRCGSPCCPPRLALCNRCPMEPCTYLTNPIRSAGRHTQRSARDTTAPSRPTSVRVSWLPQAPLSLGRTIPAWIPGQCQRPLHDRYTRAPRAVKAAPGAGLGLGEARGAPHLGPAFLGESPGAPHSPPFPGYRIYRGVGHVDGNDDDCT